MRLSISVNFELDRLVNTNLLILWRFLNGVPTYIVPVVKSVKTDGSIMGGDDKVTPNRCFLETNR